jgi:hypothetical protein
VYTNPGERGPSKLIDRHDLLQAYMTAHHAKDIAVVVRVEKEYDPEEDDFKVPADFSYVKGRISSDVVAESEYLLFLFNNEADGNEYIESLKDLLHAELWVKGSCVSEV